jgi:hypothetical protein
MLMLLMLLVYLSRGIPPRPSAFLTWTTTLVLVLKIPLLEIALVQFSGSTLKEK